MKSVSQLLEKIWLNHKESAIYVACLQYGKLSASTIAKMTGIPRSSIYDLTADLLKQWYIKVGKHRGKSYFFAVEPHDIYIMLNERKNLVIEQVDQFKNSLPQLEELKQYRWLVPEIQYYEGKQALEYCFQRIAAAAYSYSIFSVDHLLQHVYHDLDHLQESLSWQDIKWAKRIMAYSPTAIEYLNYQTNPKIQWKLLPPWYVMPSEITIYDGVLVWMSFGEHPSILEIKHPIYHQSQKDVFDYIWNSLPNYDSSIGS